MTAEKYVNTVVHRVKCSRSKRKEIRQQLLSDISAAEENGEGIEVILKRMGSVKALAKEFNENLPEVERKKYKRKKISCILGAVAVTLILLAAVIWWIFPKYSELGSDGKFQEEVVEARTKEVVQMLDGDDFASLKEMATPAMEHALIPEMIKSIKSQISDDWGEFQSWGRIYMMEMTQMGKTYAVVQAMAGYENASVTYTITFDEDMKLAGLYLR